MLDDYSTEAGEHGWIVYLYEKIANNRFVRRDSADGIVEVSEENEVILGKLVVGNREGSEVTFDVIVENRGQEIVYYPVVRVYYSYEAPDGEFGKPILVFERQPKELFPGETYKDWFKMTLTNPGKHHFTLYVNGKWEDEETITTTSKANIEAWMECAPELVSEDVDSVTCKVNVKNSGSASAEVWVTNIYFAGGEVYDRSSDNNLVNPNPSSLSLNPALQEHSRSQFQLMMNCRRGFRWI